LLALQPPLLEECNADPQSIGGVIGLAGVYNLERLAKNPFGKIFIQAVFGSDRRAWKEASPVHHIHKKAPPFFMVNGAWDFPQLRWHTMDMETRLKEEKIPVKTILLPRVHHWNVCGLFGPQDNQYVCTTIEFIKGCK
jgi:hypothetical protein